jgi:hypothetical protein
MKIFVGKVGYAERLKVQSLWLQTWHNQGARFDKSFLDDRNTNLDHVTDFVIYLDNKSISAAARVSYHPSLHHSAETDLFFEQLKECGKPFYLLNSCFVSSNHRGKGLSKALDRERVLFALRDGGAETFVIAVGNKRMDTFSKIGFDVIAKNSAYTKMFLGGVSLYLMKLNKKTFKLDQIKNYGPKIPLKLATKDFSELNVFSSHDHSDLRESFSTL